MNTNFRNYIAAFGWGLSAVFLSFVALMTYLLTRDGAPEGYRFEVVAIIVAGFWIAGLGFAAYTASKPCFFVTVRPTGIVSVRWRYPFASIRREVLRSEVGEVSLVESSDSDGDPYFRARVTLSDGATFDIAEGHDRGRCGRAREAFLAALGK